MKKAKLFHLKNEMLVANDIANFIGVVLAIVLIYRAEPFPKELFDNPIIYWTDALFDPFAFFYVIVMTLLYEKPIRHYRGRHLFDYLGESQPEHPFPGHY